MKIVEIYLMLTIKKVITDLSTLTLVIKYDLIYMFKL